MTTQFDEELKQRLLAFQRAHGLDESGVVGTDTWTKLAESATAGVVQAQLVGQLTPSVSPGGGLPPATLPTQPGPMPSVANANFGAGFRAASASGEVLAGETVLGEGAFAAAEANLALTGATTTVAEGTVVVGGTTVAEGAVVTGGTLARVGAAAGAAAGPAAVVIVGAVVVAGTMYFIIDGLSRTRAKPGPGEEYPGTSLPGGAPPPAVAPGADPPKPAQAPGTPQTPAATPGANPATPVTTPGASKEPVEAPGIVDDPDVCLQLIKKGVTHDHHIFPRQFIHLFRRIGIDIDEYTVTLKATEHIGARGLHSTMDWNEEWDIFFDSLPEASLTDGQASSWYNKALKKGFDMMIEAGIERKRVHPYRK